MKKFLIVLAVMIMLAASNSYAVIMQSPDARVKTSVWTSTTGVYTGNAFTADAYTPTAGSALTSGNRVVGYAVTGSSNPQVGLYDAATTTGAASLTNAMLFDEAACASNTSLVVFYPAPKSLTNGLAIVRNASTTTVVIFYE